MTFWLPNRIMQGATLLCAFASAAVLWLALSQPWLGLALTAAPASTAAHIASVDPDGPARAAVGRSRLVALGTPDAAPAATLSAADLIEEPDVLETYAELRAFFARQSELAGLLRRESVALHVDGGGQPPATVTVQPQRRPVASLPAAFWVQLLTGAGSLMIGAWVLALRPRDRETRLFALTGAMICLSAYAAAVYSTRELAIDGGLFRVLSVLNHAGALGFGAGMIALFLCYPRPLVPARALWIVPAVVVPIFLTDTLHVFNPMLGLHLPVMIEMLLIVGLIVVQWFANRDDPRARAALRWLGTAVIVGAGAFVSLIVAPILVESAPVMRQGYAFGFFLLIYAGLALGVSRYRLFDLDEWAFRILFYTVGMLALLAVDALLIMVLHLQRDTSFGIALLAVAFVYLPLRGTLWERLVARQNIESHELFRSVIDVSFATLPSERAERWRALLQRLFDPAAIEPAATPVADVVVAKEGLEAILPPVADAPSLVLRYPWRGQRLFGTVHLQLTRQLVRLMRQAEESRAAYERGRAEERLRIARDLHDDVGARLLSGLHKTGVDDTHRVLRDAIADIRTIVSGLSADRLPLGQVIAALRHETGERLETAGIELDWPPEARDDDPLMLDYRVYRSLVSVHREIVSNIVRHAGAKRVEIRIAAGGPDLVMSVRDDGRGMSPQAASAPQGTGLRGMIRRTEELGGSLTLLPVASGTAIEVRLPAGATP